MVQQLCAIIDDMSLVTTVEKTGDGPYGIDQQSPDKAYALTVIQVISGAAD